MLQQIIAIYPYYRSGYCLYIINCNGVNASEVIRGLTQLEPKFSEPLPEPCVVIVYGKFPSILQINEARSILMTQ
ncbi:hypothetical protein KUTeg_023127 [Tegillarca granosa]|uniref:Uncharacterized protein n=1 Tax=Tegillarca granosa TaxID=220873 RepID=A0ABQ9E693_TEGGR|nr:hypothetical protein KUTeg_023127 [Tegillarca granosa]